MFCYQCEQTLDGRGCLDLGACGKDSESAALQDRIIGGLKSLSVRAHRARELGVTDAEIDEITLEGLFATVTNVNFDPRRLEDIVLRIAGLMDRAQKIYAEACAGKGKVPETLQRPGLNDIAQRRVQRGADVTGIEELLTYGIKGIAAYLHHAKVLGEDPGACMGFLHEALSTIESHTAGMEKLLELCMRCGAENLKAMELLDRAHTNAYGHPEPTSVRITPKQGKAILVSGHDLKDLEELLKQTEGKGINVYTHGEMLPAHGYPGLKKNVHLAGNYGGAWQDQRGEFETFPGAILMTTNCIQQPMRGYNDRIFTAGPVAWPGVKHLTGRDFSPVIQAALDAPGFEAELPEKSITVGFGRNTVLGVADKVIGAVKEGKIRHFFLIGGCDGAKSGRNYYTDLATSVPKDCVILTLACGKYRFNKLDFGDIGGIPRLLDIGQCNDAYSAIMIASALAKAFDTDVNGLPLSLVLSWYEQKAVAILLTLLHLGIKGIRLGPSLPAFVTPAVLNVLVENFDVKPISTPERDLEAILG